MNTSNFPREELFSVMLWCSVYLYYTALLNKAWTQVLRIADGYKFWIRRWWWIISVVWLTYERRLTLFPVGTIVRDPYHLESPTRRTQDLNLLRTRVQDLLNEVVQVFKCLIYLGYWNTKHWKCLVCEKDAKANINSVELKFAKLRRSENFCKF